MVDKFDILLIEDSTVDARIIDIYLGDAYDDGTYTLTCANSLSTGLNFLSAKIFNVILLDLTLPDSNGLDTFKRVFKKVPETPIIILSGQIDEAIGLSAIKSGAQDFLLKGKMQGKELRRSINYSIERNALLKQLSEKTKINQKYTDELIKENTKLSHAQKLAHIGSWGWNKSTNGLTLSDELFEIYGLTHEETDATYELLLEKVHQEDREFTKKMILGTYKTQIPFNFYHRIVRPNNEIRMIHSIGKVNKDNNGKPIIMFGTSQDVTERMKGEELELLAIAATKSFNSVVIANKHGEIEWVNEGFTKLSGYKLEDINPDEKSLFKIIKEVNFQKGKDFSQHTFGKTPISYERECLTKDGKKYWVISTITPVLDKKGEIERIIAIDTDITHRKQVEEELLRINNIKEQFLTNMSHEIRTPMNAIVGFTDLLLKTELTADQKQCIDAVKTSGRNLIVIINDILDFSKIEAGKITFEQIEFDLKHLISTLTELILPKSMEKNIKISTKIDKRIPEQLIGDPTRLNQIFLNLVGNAIKFTEKGDVKIYADFVSEDDEHIELKFSVKDTGIGIPEDKLGCVFEGFMQATNDTNRKYCGTGLGLTIVKQLVELQGGSIAVKSTINLGTSFIFNLKFQKILPSLALKSEFSGKTSELEHIEVLNILLVEDNRLNQILAKKVLTNWKWNVDVADNGLIALQKLKNTTYDIVLMDIQMPEMDGYEATRQIRKLSNPTKRDIPIIALTAHAITGETEKCYNAGMNDYITKPFDEKVLYEKIITVCKKNILSEMNQKT